MLCAFKPPQNMPGNCVSTSSRGCWSGFAQHYLVGRSGEALSIVRSLAAPSQWSNTAKKAKEEMTQWSRSSKSTHGLVNSMYFNFLFNCHGAYRPSDGSLPSATFPQQEGLKQGAVVPQGSVPGSAGKLQAPLKPGNAPAGEEMKHLQRMQQLPQLEEPGAPNMDTKTRCKYTPKLRS